MSMFQSASDVHIEGSTFNNTRDQTNIGLIIHNSNNGMFQTTPTPFIIVRTYVSL